MAAASVGRQRYRWLVLLVAAVMLVIWFLTPADQGDPTSSGGSSADTPSATPSASHELTQTNTPTTDTTQFPPTGEADTEDPESGLPIVRVGDLPPQVATTLALIADGGPYPEDRDGVTFENREGLLPDQPRGYYSEYTVPTPGSDDRGARRIVAGDGGEVYYTGDHYESFSRLAT